MLIQPKSPDWRRKPSSSSSRTPQELGHGPRPGLPQQNACPTSPPCLSVSLPIALTVPSASLSPYKFHLSFQVHFRPVSLTNRTLFCLFFSWGSPSLPGMLSSSPHLTFLHGFTRLGISPHSPPSHLFPGWMCGEGQGGLGDRRPADRFSQPGKVAGWP